MFYKNRFCSFKDENRFWSFKVKVSFWVGYFWWKNESGFIIEKGFGNFWSKVFKLVTNSFWIFYVGLWPISCWFKCQKVVKTIILRSCTVSPEINTHLNILERRVFIGPQWCFIYLEWFIASWALSVPS